MAGMKSSFRYCKLAKKSKKKRVSGKYDSKVSASEKGRS